MNKENTFDKKALETSLPEAGEVEVLKDSAEEVAGVKVRPWGFDEVEAMTPVFEKIMLDLKARKISLRDFIHKTETTNKKGEKETKIEVINFDQLYFCLMPRMREIFRISLHITDAEISKLTPSQTTLIFAKIVMQNIEYLKNSLALVTMLTARIGA